jgi:diguanylate cyclase (GGDEF)-like protein
MSMMDGKIREQEVNIRHRDGHRLPVLLRTVPIKKFTKILGVMEVFIDVSSRQKIENEAEEYKELAFTDKLTGLYNRRYIEDFIKSRMEDYQKRGIPFCVMFLDIDHFKLFNDNYGHELGDEVICMVGKACSLMIRSSDLFGRFGGEEFVAVLPGTNEQNMYVIADAMRSIVENTGISSGGDQLKVTISIGATMVRPDDTAESVMKRADELLYMSKEAGRNQVTTA